MGQKTFSLEALDKPVTYSLDVLDAPGAGAKAKAAGASVVSGVLDVPASLMQLDALARKGIGTAMEAIHPGLGGFALGQSARYAQGAEDLREAPHQIAGTDPRLRGSFMYEQVPSAIGQIAAQIPLGMGAGAGLKAAGLSTKAAGMAAGAGIGVTMEGPRAYWDALGDGATEEEALKMLLVGTGAGATEAAGLGGILARVPGMGSLLAQTLVGAVEEGGQEAVSQALLNLGAQQIYDEDREILEGVVEGAGAGSIAGGLATALLEAMVPGRSRTRNDSRAQNEDTESLALPDEEVARRTQAESLALPEEEVQRRTQAAVPKLESLGDIKVEEAPAPTAPADVYIGRFAAERGAIYQPVRVSGKNAGKFRAMHDAETGSLLVNAELDPGERVRVSMAHELATHAFKAQDPQSWAEAYDTAKRVSPEFFAEREADYLAAYAATQETTPEAAREMLERLEQGLVAEEGMAFAGEAVRDWVLHLQENPGVLRDLMTTAEGQGLATRLLEALKRALSYVTGGRVQSTRQKLDAALERLRRPEGLSPEEALSLAEVYSDALDQMVGAPLPEFVQQAQEAEAPVPAEVTEGDASVAPQSPEASGPIVPPTYRQVREPEIERPEVRPQPSSPGATSLTPKQRRRADRKRNRAEARARRLREAPAQTSKEAREQLQRAGEIERTRSKPSRPAVTRRPMESRQAQAAREWEEGSDAAPKFGLARDDVRSEVERRWPGTNVDITERADGYGDSYWYLDSIVVPKEGRKQGTGSEVMEYLTAEADRRGIAMTLTPSTDFGASSVARLRRFYARFGFKRNRGRHADLAKTGAMIRQPGTPGKFGLAWHGSAADFDEFSDEFIGSGEGAQAYGYGHYFAGREGVAKFYRDKMQERRQPVVRFPKDRRDAAIDLVSDYLNKESQGLGESLETIERYIASVRMLLEGAGHRSVESLRAGYGRQAKVLREASRSRELDAMEQEENWVEAMELELALKLLDAGHVTVKLAPRGRLYQVDLAPEEDEYLLWDEPIKSQSDKVRSALGEAALGELSPLELLDAFTTSDYAKAFSKARDVREAQEIQDMPPAPEKRQAVEAWAQRQRELGTKSSAYNLFLGQMGKHVYGRISAATGSDRLASQALRAAGIRGIKYLDGSSRSKGEGSYNYVLFDPADITIKQKFSLASDALKSAEAFAARNIASRGGLPESVFKAKIARDGRLQRAINEMKLTLRDVRRALKKHYGKPVEKLDRTEVLRLDNALKDPARMAALPKPLQAPMRAMRASVDNWSQAMIDAGVVEGELALRVGDNMGFYATRSYRVFDDPKWAKKVPQDVKNKAFALLRSRHPKKTDAEIEGIINQILDRDLENVFNLMGKLGSRDTSILTKRQVIAPEIRALMGEYKDPVVNYARSVFKMAHLIENHKLLEEVRDLGLSEGWLRAPDEGPAGDIFKEIPEGSKAMGPLAGHLTTPEILQAFEDAVEQVPVGPLLSGYMKINGLVKAGKTVGSAVTQVRNFFGNVGFAIANGHFDLRAYGSSFPAMLTKWGATERAGQKYARLDAKKWRAYYNEALEYGVLHESASAGEMQDILKDAMRRDMDSLIADGGFTFGKALNAATELYQANDDFWKLYAWENEQARYRKAKPNWSDAEVKAHTASIVRDTYPTYSLVPRLIKKMRRFPVTGTFVSFPAEVVRVSKNTVRQAHREMIDPDLKRIGAQRIVGMTLAATVPAAIAAATRFMLGISDEDDERLRNFVAPWSKYGDLAWIKNGDKPTYVDMSFTDPYSYIKTPLKALWMGDDFEEKVVDAATEFAEPFLGEEILAGAIIDLARNKKKGGGEVYNEAESPSEQYAAMVEHLWNAVEPGTINSIERLVAAETGYITPSGRSFDTMTELVTLGLGARATPVDVGQSLRYRAGDFNRDLRNSSRILGRVVNRAGTVTEGEVREAHASMERAREHHFEQMADMVRAATALGVERSTIMSSLKDGGLSQEVIRDLLRGEYRPHKRTAELAVKEMKARR